MKLIQDFGRFDTPKLIRILIGFRRPLVGYPIIFALIPMVGLVALRPHLHLLWWFIGVYFGSILLLACLMGAAYGRLVAELRRRMEEGPENQQTHAIAAKRGSA